MTIFNAEQFIERTIDSLINQTYQQWELIVVDNFSTDCTLNLLRGYNDDRIRLYPLETNIGRTSALNFACIQAKGRYIAILDADDLSSPDRLQVQSDFMNINLNVGAVASFAYIIDSTDNIIGLFKPPAYPQLLNEYFSWAMPVVHSTMMMRRSILIDYLHGYSPNLVIGQDWDLCIRLSRLFPFFVIPKFLGSWRRHPASITANIGNFDKGRSESIQILLSGTSLCYSRDSYARNRISLLRNYLAILYIYFRGLRVIKFVLFLFKFILMVFGSFVSVGLYRLILNSSSSSFLYPVE